MRAHLQFAYRWGFFGCGFEEFTWRASPDLMDVNRSTFQSGTRYGGPNCTYRSSPLAKAQGLLSHSLLSLPFWGEASSDSIFIGSILQLFLWIFSSVVRLLFVSLRFCYCDRVKQGSRPSSSTYKTGRLEGSIQNFHIPSPVLLSSELPAFA